MSDLDRDDHLGTPIVERARRSPPFDNRLSVDDGERFLTDPLAEDYIRIPPDGWLLVPGMLPPQEMEVRAALAEAIEVFNQDASLGFWRKLLRPRREAAAAEALILDKVNALAAMITCSREHRAAATRIFRSYRGTARGLMEWAQRLAQERKA